MYRIKPRSPGYGVTFKMDKGGVLAAAKTVQSNKLATVSKKKTFLDAFAANGIGVGAWGVTEDQITIEDHFDHWGKLAVASGATAVGTGYGAYRSDNQVTKIILGLVSAVSAGTALYSTVKKIRVGDNEVDKVTKQRMKNTLLKMTQRSSLGSMEGRSEAKRVAHARFNVVSDFIKYDEIDNMKNLPLPSWVDKTKITTGPRAENETDKALCNALVGAAQRLASRAVLPREWKDTDPIRRGTGSDAGFDGQDTMLKLNARYATGRPLQILSTANDVTINEGIDRWYAYIPTKITGEIYPVEPTYISADGKRMAPHLYDFPANAVISGPYAIRADPGVNVSNLLVYFNDAHLVGTSKESLIDAFNKTLDPAEFYKLYLYAQRPGLNMGMLGMTLAGNKNVFVSDPGDRMSKESFLFAQMLDPMMANWRHFTATSADFRMFFATYVERHAMDLFGDKNTSSMSWLCLVLDIVSAVLAAIPVADIAGAALQVVSTCLRIASIAITTVKKIQASKGNIGTVLSTLWDGISGAINQVDGLLETHFSDAGRIFTDWAKTKFGWAIDFYKDGERVVDTLADVGLEIKKNYTQVSQQLKAQFPQGFPDLTSALGQEAEDYIKRYTSITFGDYDSARAQQARDTISEIEEANDIFFKGWQEKAKTGLAYELVNILS